MGGCQNYGPFLGTLNIRCCIKIGTQKGAIILTTTLMFSHVSMSASSRQLLKSSCVDASFSLVNFLHLCQVGTRGSKPAWEPRKNRASKTNSLYFLLKHGETYCSNYCWIQQKQMKGLRHPEKPTGESRHTF